MVITFKTRDRIFYPVFKLPHSNWYFRDGLLFLDNQIVDDTNMPGNTLGKRRIQTPHKNLLPLRRAIDQWIGILKQPTNAFIDNKGRPFLYEKTEYLPLKYHKLKKVERKEVCSGLWFEGVNFLTVVPRPPRDGVRYGGFLYYKGYPWILYDYATEKLKDTRRKI